VMLPVDPAADGEEGDPVGDEPVGAVDDPPGAPESGLPPD